MNLSIKIFLSLGILATAASWYLSVHNNRLYQQLSARERHTALETETRNAAARIQEKFTGWQSSLRSILPYMVSANESVTNESLDKHLTGHPDFLSIQIFTVPNEKSSRLSLVGKGFTTEPDKRFEGKSRAAFQRDVLKSTRAWLRKEIIESKERSFVATNLFKATGLPLTTFAFRSKVEGVDLYSWIVVSVWQDALLRDTSRGTDRQSLLLTKKGEILAAHDKALAKGGSYRTNPAMRQAIAKPTIVGVSQTYLNKSTHYVAAFAEVSTLDLLVLTEKNMSPILTEMAAIDDGNLLWAAAMLISCLLISLFLGSRVEKDLHPISDILERFANAKYDVKIPARGVAAEIIMRLTDLGHILQMRLAAKKEEERPTGSSLASHLRHTLIPQADIKRPALTISGYYQPAKECGGVLWGHKSLSETLEFIYMIDDAETGEPAALNMGLFYSTISTWLLDATHRRELGANPALFISFMMELLRNHPTVTTSLAAQAVVIDTQSNRLLYCGTGHVNTLIISNASNDERNFETLGSQRTRVIALKSGKDPITARGIPLSTQEIALMRNDRIVLFSKGLVESKNPDGQAWGFGNCVSSFQTNSQQTAKEFKTEVLASAFTYYRSTSISDDIAFVAIEYIARAEAQTAEATPTQSLKFNLSGVDGKGKKDNFGSFAHSESKAGPSAVNLMPPPPPPPPIVKPAKQTSDDEQTDQIVPASLSTNQAMPPPPIPLATDDFAAMPSIPLATDTPDLPQEIIRSEQETPAPPVDDAVFSLDLAEGEVEQEPMLATTETEEDGNWDQFTQDEITLADMDPSMIEHPFTERPSQIRQYGGEQMGTESESSALIEDTAAEQAKPKGKGRYKIKLPTAG